MVKPRQHEPTNKSTLGLKQSNALTNMPFGALLDVLNMNLDGLGGKSARKGYGEFFHLTNGVGGARIHDLVSSLIQYKPTTGNSQVLAFANRTIYKQNGYETDIIRTGLTANARWEWCQYNDFIHGVNGNDSSFLYNGTNYVTISITAPTAHPTLSLPAIGTGSLTDTATYSYIVVFWDNDRARESAPFSPTTAPSQLVAAPDQTIRLSNLPAATAGQGVTHYRIYRRRVSVGATADELEFTYYTDISYATYNPTTGTGQWDDTGAIGVSAVSSQTLEVDDGTIDTGYTAHPQADLIEEAFDRVFMVPTANPTMLIYSKAGGKSFAFPTGNFFPIGRKDGYRILRIEKHGESIIIHKRNGVWILDGDPATSTPIRITGQGTQDARLSASDDNVLLRLTPDGFYLTSPTENSATDLRDFYIGKDIVEEEKLIDWSNTNNAHIVAYNGNNARHIMFLQPSIAGGVTVVNVLDTSLREWVKYRLNNPILSSAKVEINGDKNLMLGDDYGMVWLWDVNDADGTNLGPQYLNGYPTSSTNNSLTDTDIVDDDGTVTAAGATTLTDSTKAWVTNQWIGYQVYIKTGTGMGSSGIVVSNTATQLTIAAPWAVNPVSTDFYQIGGWTIDSLIGVAIEIEGNTIQRRRIVSNTADTLVVDVNWSTNPTTLTKYEIGKILWFAEEFWNDNGAPNFWKRMRWIVPSIRQTIPGDIKISFRRDFISGAGTQKEFELGGSAGLWDLFDWDDGYWDATSHTIKRLRIRGKYHYYSIRYESIDSGKPFKWDGHTSVFQVLYDRNK